MRGFSKQQTTNRSTYVLKQEATRYMVCTPCSILRLKFMEHIQKRCQIQKQFRCICTTLFKTSSTAYPTDFVPVPTVKINYKWLNGQLPLFQYPLGFCKNIVLHKKFYKLARLVSIIINVLSTALNILYDMQGPILIAYSL